MTAVKKLFLATVALSALAGSALAADLPYRHAAPAPAPAFVAVPVFTWTGFYIGANAGYAFGEQNATTTGLSSAAQGAINAGIVPGGAKSDKGGFTGGGQIGYNYQIGRYVLGLETDFQYTDRKQTSTVSTLAGYTAAYRSQLDYLGTVRGRIGYTVDNWMIYATGGFAYGEVKLGYAGINPTYDVIAAGRNSTATGYAVGGGIEYAIPALNLGGSAATIKVEYLYYNLGKKTVVANDLNGVTPLLANRFENDGHIVRAGLNWKFSAF